MAFIGRKWALSALLCAATAAFAAIAGHAADAPGLQHDVVFDSYGAWSDSQQMIQRLLSPLTAARLKGALSDAAQRPRAQAIDLSRERFVVYVPATEPAQGYGLLVFIPPWEDAKLPAGWNAALDRHGIIFVSAADSGNAADVLDRREPLALLAAHNVQQRYRIDAARVYIGGFSGGARVALRLALAYPDVFRGALLNAGSDPIGSEQLPLPAAPLFARFQQSTRVIYLTGKHDEFNIDHDAQSRSSLREWCVAGIVTQIQPWLAHEVAGPPAFDRALSALTEPPADAKALDTCRADLDKQLHARTQDVEDLIAAGKPEQARSALHQLDARFGGLAAPRSVELAGRIEGR